MVRAHRPLPVVLQETPRHLDVEWALYSHMSTLVEVRCTRSRSIRACSKQWYLILPTRGSSTSPTTRPTLTATTPTPAPWPASTRTTRWSNESCFDLCSISDVLDDISNHNGPSLYPQQGMLPHPQFGEEQQPQGEGLPAGTPSSDRAPGGGPESVDAIYRAVVDAASKGVHVTITTTVSGTTQASPVHALSAMSAFTASIREPVNLPQAVSAVLHGHQEGETIPQQARVRQVRPGRGQKNMDPGKSTPDGPEANDYFRSPGRGTPRGQWDGETHHGGGFDSQNNNNAWGGEEFLECSTQVRSSPCMERPASLAPAPPCPTDGSNDHSLVMAHDKAYLDDSFRFNNCGRAPANYKERLEQTVERCAHLNGTTPHFNTRGYGEVLGPPRQDDDQSPSSSTSLEGPLATAKDYSHYNGHFNGMAPSPSDTKSLSSEEDLRQPDSPSSELLHYRSRTFNMGELVWGQLKGFPPWPAKLAGDEQVHSAAMQLREQAKVRGRGSLSPPVTILPASASA